MQQAADLEIATDHALALDSASNNATLVYTVLIPIYGDVALSVIATSPVHLG